MYPNNQPLASVARPATDALSARLARVNRGGSGITAIQRDNGTPFLTNRPEVVDELSDAEVASIVDPDPNWNGLPPRGGQQDPRSMLRQFITANDNTGIANAVNLRSREPLMDAQAQLPAQAVQRGFAREQKRADTNSEAATAFDPSVARLRSANHENALAEADVKNQGDYARASADRYKADTDFDIAGLNANSAADSSDFKAVLQGYGDTMAGMQQVQDPSVREQGIAPIRSLLIKLLQGMNANATQQP